MLRNLHRLVLAAVVAGCIASAYGCGSTRTLWKAGTTGAIGAAGGWLGAVSGGPLGAAIGGGLGAAFGSAISQVGDERERREDFQSGKVVGRQGAQDLLDAQRTGRLSSVPIRDRLWSAARWAAIAFFAWSAIKLLFGSRYREHIWDAIRAFFTFHPIAALGSLWKAAGAKHTEA